MKIDNQVKYWKWAAWTLPFVALGAIAFGYWIGTSTSFHIIMVITCTTFFGISVFWWWWALEKVAKMVKDRLTIEQKFEAIIDEMRSLRKDIKDDLGSR
jgi:hypothetical protein